jgi:hypothetical protein
MPAAFRVVRRHGPRRLAEDRNAVGVRSAERLARREMLHPRRSLGTPEHGNAWSEDETYPQEGHDALEPPRERSPTAVRGAHVIVDHRLVLICPCDVCSSGGRG